MNNLIYTDSCCNEIRTKIKQQLNFDIVLGFDINTWTLNDSLNIIMNPNIKLAVINCINEITVIEMSLLTFMCKPILITSNKISDYPIIKTKIASYINTSCDLRKDNSQFIEWYFTQGI
jgi:hypothetical protein